MVKYIYRIILTAMTPQTYKPIFYNFCSTPQGIKTIKPEVDKCENQNPLHTYTRQSSTNQDSKLTKAKDKDVIGTIKFKIQNPSLTSANAIETHMLHLMEKKIKKSLES